MNKKQVSRPTIYIGDFTVAMPFCQARKISGNAKMLLALASAFRLHGGNLYRLCDNTAIERMFGLSHGRFMRAKKQLRDAGLLDYEGKPGDYSELVERWEKINKAKWEYDL